MEKYAVIIPVYRGASTIKKLYDAVKFFFDSQHLQYEVVFVYDCGNDQSWEVIKRIKTESPGHVKAIHLSRNFGQHNAIICGIKHAEGSFIITMDEDLQHNPQDIALLITEQKQQDYDVVYGKYKERRHSFFRNTTSFLLQRLLKAGIPDLHPDYSAYRLVKTDIAKKTVQMNNSYTFLDGYLSWITQHISSVKVIHSESNAGKSSYTLRKLIEHSVNIFVTFSNLPIRFLTYSSIVIMLFSFAFSGYVFLRKIIYNDFVSGFATFAIMMGFGIGLILLGLGIVGEYIHRINQKTTHRPNFTEKIVL